MSRKRNRNISCVCTPKKPIYLRAIEVKLTSENLFPDSIVKYLERVYLKSMLGNAKIKYYPKPLTENGLTFYIHNHLSLFAYSNEYIEYNVIDGDYLVFGYINDYMTLNRIGHQIMRKFSKYEYEQRFNSLPNKVINNLWWQSTEQNLSVDDSSTFPDSNFYVRYVPNKNDITVHTVDLASTYNTKDSIDFTISNS